MHTEETDLYLSGLNETMKILLSQNPFCERHVSPLNHWDFDSSPGDRIAPMPRPASCKRQKES